MTNRKDNNRVEYDLATTHECENLDLTYDFML